MMEPIDISVGSGSKIIMLVLAHFVTQNQHFISQKFYVFLQFKVLCVPYNSIDPHLLSYTAN